MPQMGGKRTLSSNEKLEQNGRGMAKYDPLRIELKRDGRKTIVLSFDEIERLVGPLPPSSHANQWWWGNKDQHAKHYAQCRAWTEAGYHASADLPAKSVRFERQ